MTKLGIHPMASYGDPSYGEILIWGSKWSFWGRKRRWRVCGGFGRDFHKKIKENARGLAYVKKKL